MFTRLDIGQFDLLRHHIGTRTPVGTGKIGRSDRLFHFFLCISFLSDIRGQTFLQPHARCRIETAERGTVITPRDKVQHFFAIHRNNIALLYKLVATTMTTMSGNDIFQTHVLCSFRNGKAGRHIFTGKNIRIRLTDIVNRIHQRFHMSFRQCVTGYIRFVHINGNTGNISFGSPGIDKDTYISPAFQ